MIKETPVCFPEGTKPSSVISAILYENCPHGYPHLEIEHDGTLSWADGQQVKNLVFGKEIACFENYPPHDQVVNGNSQEFHFRHIFVWPKDKAWPNIRPDIV